MTRLFAARSFVLLPAIVCMAGILSGCVRSELSGLPATAPSFNIPPPIRPRPPLSPELATLVYPEVSKISRDPFLTVLEQGLAEGKDMSAFLPKKVEKAVVVKAVKGRRRPRHQTLFAQRIIRQLHSEVHGIILGAPNVFIFKGRSYQEGDVIEGTDWVVVSVQETGIRLRSKDGTGSDYLPFTTSASIVFDFSADHGQKNKPSSGELEIHKPRH